MPTADPASRLLLVMRHGKAESSADHDSDRDLTDKGRAQARLVGEYLESQGVRPTRVLVSSAARTRATWQSVLETMPGFDGTVTYHDEIYTGGPGEVLDLLHTETDDAPAVMVIGHEPTMGVLTQVLADEESDSGSLAQARIGLPTGAVSVLSGQLGSWADLGEETLTLHTVVHS